MSKNILVKFAGHKRGGFKILIDKIRKGDNKIYFIHTLGKYSKTEKINVSDIKRIEKETRLTQEEYIQELVNMDINKGQIIKDRYCLTYKNQYFEIDIYPFSNDLAILEIELNNELQEIEFPYYLDILKEVTEDPRYRNSNLAKTKVLKR